MRRRFLIWKVAFLAGVVAVLTAIGVGLLMLGEEPAKAEPADWPSLTMTYSVAVPTNDMSITQTRELAYTSHSSWIETVTAADPIVHNAGTSSDVGSYQKVEKGVYTTYDAVTGETTSETVEDGVVRIPRGGLMPSSIAIIGDAYDKELTSVSTTTKVCFNDVCTENAPGWGLRERANVIVFADDARGIPVTIGDFVVTEVRVQGQKETVR